MKASTNNSLTQIGQTYWDSIPLDRVQMALAVEGFEMVQEDGTPWAGILCGREGRMVADLTKNGQKSKRALCLSWYKMEVTGRYEVVAYVS